jgi:hypothetical protein
MKLIAKTLLDEISEQREMRKKKKKKEKKLLGGRANTLTTTK